MISPKEVMLLGCSLWNFSGETSRGELGLACTDFAEFFIFLMCHCLWEAFPDFTGRTWFCPIDEPQPLQISLLCFSARGILIIIPRVCFSFQTWSSLETWLCLSLPNLSFRACLPQNRFLMQVWGMSWKVFSYSQRWGLGKMGLRQSSWSFFLSGASERVPLSLKRFAQRDSGCWQTPPLPYFLQMKKKREKRFHFLLFTFHLIGKILLEGVTI